MRKALRPSFFFRFFLQYFSVGFFTLPKQFILPPHGRVSLFGFPLKIYVRISLSL